MAFLTLMKYHPNPSTPKPSLHSSQDALYSAKPLMQIADELD